MTIQQYEQAKRIMHEIELRQFYIDALKNCKTREAEVKQFHKEIDELMKDFSAI